MSEIVITRPDSKELTTLNIKEWGPWECEPSRFDWEYDSEEWCYIFEGRAKIKTKDAQVEIKKGDLVRFPKGLRCSWEVTEKIKKVYTFR